MFSVTVAFYGKTTHGTSVPRSAKDTRAKAQYNTVNKTIQCCVYYWRRKLNNKRAANNTKKVGKEANAVLFGAYVLVFQTQNTSICRGYASKGNLVNINWFNKFSVVR